MYGIWFFHGLNVRTIFSKYNQYSLKYLPRLAKILSLIQRHFTSEYRFLVLFSVVFLTVACNFSIDLPVDTEFVLQ